jgi:DNA replication ATP-dependent helicase Dna2
MKPSHTSLLADILTFVEDEQCQAAERLRDTWSRPLAAKLQAGQTQRFLQVESAESSDTLWAYPDEGESRFREGDLLVLHTGSPVGDLLGRGLALELDDGERWLLRGKAAGDVLRGLGVRVAYADADAIDLSAYFRATMDEVRTSEIGREILMPLLCGEIDIGFSDARVASAEAVARQRGFNDRQVQAVGLAVAAEQLACIQGPPGTGKSAVLALAVRLMVGSGERVLVTSHTHMAINNVLNKIAAEGAPVVKIGALTQCRALDASVPRCEDFAGWDARPRRGGYAVGATPFATCTGRLEGCEFDVIVFDEASQVTVPLALMAMRKGRRFVFVGDQQQLPPVVLSRSVFDRRSMSAFATLTAADADHCVMLDQTYRLNRWLTEWPSRTYYGGALRSAGHNRDRRLVLRDLPARLSALLGADHCGLFVPTLDRTARVRNERDAELVATLCSAALAGGLAASDIGVVTPYRAQGRAVREALRRAVGQEAARAIVADTVERMQGQEREMVIVSLATGDEAFLGAVAGFFFEPQRLNVSITRAKSKLIVIGPSIDNAPPIEPDELRQWVLQYMDLVRHLERVEVA